MGIYKDSKVRGSGLGGLGVLGVVWALGLGLMVEEGPGFRS